MTTEGKTDLAVRGVIGIVLVVLGSLCLWQFVERTGESHPTRTSTTVRTATTTPRRAVGKRPAGRTTVVLRSTTNVAGSARADGAAFSGEDTTPDAVLAILLTGGLGLIALGCLIPIVEKFSLAGILDADLRALPAKTEKALGDLAEKLTEVTLERDGLREELQRKNELVESYDRVIAAIGGAKGGA